MTAFSDETDCTHKLQPGENCAICAGRLAARSIATQRAVSNKLADDLERLCCAETEGKFFDLVTENIGTILAALRGNAALSASPVAQEPVATKATQQASADFLHEEMIKLGSPLTYTACLTLTKRITDTNTLAWAGEVNKLCTEIGSLKNEIAALKSAANPPATPAGLGADEIARCLVENDPNYSIYHMPGGPVRKWKAMSGAVYGTKELSDEAADRVIQRANAILALLSRAGDQK